MSFELVGKVKLIKDEQIISDAFKKREFVVIDDSSQYPQEILFQMTQDRCDELDKYQEGQEVNVKFNLRGREWTSPTGDVRYFNTLEAWRLEEVGSQANAPVEAPPVEAPPEGNAGDLPF